MVSILLTRGGHASSCRPARPGTQENQPITVAGCYTVICPGRPARSRPSPSVSGNPAPMPKNMLDGGQVIVDYLIREKVPYAFGLCGHGNIQFIDALYERRDEITTISVHHETVAGFMADCYYRVSGRPVATFTSCGPGSM